MSAAIKLSAGEVVTLEACEAVIEAGRQSFIDVGKALTDVRDGKLWREKYESFEDYCQKRWRWGKRRAYQLIEAGEVAKSLPESPCKILQNDSQARELAKVAPAKRAAVLEQAAASGPVTAKSIKSANKELNGSQPDEATSQSGTGSVVATLEQPTPDNQAGIRATPANDKSAEFKEACGGANILAVFIEEMESRTTTAVEKFDFETLVKFRVALMVEMGRVNTKIEAFRKAERAKKMQEAA